MTKENRGFMEKLGTIPRKPMYAIIFISVLIPTIVPISFPISINPATRVAFQQTDDIQPGDHVLLITATGVNPQQMLDTGWTWVSMVRHLWAKEGPNGEHVKITFMSYGGLDEKFELILKYAMGDKLGTEYIYGVDWVNLGTCLSYDASGFAAIAADAGWAGKVVDRYGTPLDDIPISQETKDFDISDFKLVYLIPGVGYTVMTMLGQWAPYFEGGKTNVLIISMPMYYSIFQPYYSAGTIRGLTNGLRGGAEYEALVAAQGIAGVQYASINIGPYSSTHLLAVALLILGNISFVYTTYFKKEES